MATRLASTPRVFAIIPAAGRSRRMGAAKQLLDVGGRPMLRVVIDSVAAADVAGAIVVTHRAIAEALGGPAALESGDVSATPPSAWPRVSWALNDDASTEMIDSVRIGLWTWRQRGAVGERDGFLVCPGDQPGIASDDADRCLAAFRAAPERIVIAAHDGRRGHPVIFPAALAGFVLSAACDGGLNALPRGYPGLVTSVACPSAGVTRDIDTPDDYGGGA